MNTFADKIARFIAQGAYSGLSPIAPGTAGTVIGVLICVIVKDLDLAAYGAVCAAVFAIGTWAAGVVDRMFGTKDNPTIVIDEIAGFLVSMFLVPFAWWSVIAGFLLFRFFDIIKPWPCRQLERIHGGAGVMLDDIGAGIYTNIILQAIRHLLA